jgi:hypothetical protein
MNTPTHAARIRFLLDFFSPSQREQWKSVPGDFRKSWARVGNLECEMTSPIAVLAMNLAEELNGTPRELWSESLLILDDIRDLVHYWILDSDFDYVLYKPELDEDGVFEDRSRDRIWNVLAQLCRDACRHAQLAGDPNRSTSLTTTRGTIQSYDFTLGPTGNRTQIDESV